MIIFAKQNCSNNYTATESGALPVTLPVTVWYPNHDEEKNQEEEETTRNCVHDGWCDGHGDRVPRHPCVSYQHLNKSPPPPPQILHLQLFILHSCPRLGRPPEYIKWATLGQDQQWAWNSFQIWGYCLQKMFLKMAQKWFCVQKNHSVGQGGPTWLTVCNLQFVKKV